MLVHIINYYTLEVRVALSDFLWLCDVTTAVCRNYFKRGGQGWGFKKSRGQAWIQNLLSDLGWPFQGEVQKNMAKRGTNIYHAPPPP